MFLHLGKNESLSKEHIIGVFDMETATMNGDTKKFLSSMQKKSKVVNLCNDLPKSFVLAHNGITDSVYITGMPTDTHKHRTERNYYKNG